MIPYDAGKLKLGFFTVRHGTVHAGAAPPSPRDPLFPRIRAELPGALQKFWDFMVHGRLPRTESVLGNPVPSRLPALSSPFEFLSSRGDLTTQEVSLGNCQQALASAVLLHAVSADRRVFLSTTYEELVDSVLIRVEVRNPSCAWPAAFEHLRVCVSLCFGGSCHVRVPLQNYFPPLVSYGT